MTKICIPLAEKNIELLLQKISESVKKKPDVIELWLGELFPNAGDFDANGEEFFDKIFSIKNDLGDIPFLLNVKDSKEKGAFNGSDQEKIDILREGVKRGAEYIDIDYEFDESLLRSLKNDAECSGAKLILSAHFFEGTPTFPSLKNRVERMKNSGADIVKIAAMPETKRDIISVLRLSENLERKQVPFIAMSMGGMGKFSRVMCPLLGSYLAFAALDKESSSAPGQMTIDEIRVYIEKFSV